MMRRPSIKSCFLALMALAVSDHALAAEAPRFVVETETSGIKHTYNGDFPYLAGAGVAVFDCDADGLPELFFAGGEDRAKLYRNVSKPGAALHFKESTAADLALASVTGAYPLDIDADGLVDLALLRVGENILMRGLGDCRFERANEAWNFNGGDAWTTAFSATWQPGRAWPTLAFGNFMIPDTVIMGYGDCDANDIHRPRVGGGYEKPFRLQPGHCALSMLFSDWNRDGRAELRISNDKEFYKRGEEQLFRLDDGGVGGLKPYSRDDGWQPLNIWGMGIASHDVTGDGYPEYYLTNMTDNRFEVLADGPARPAYNDKAKAFGIEAGFPFIGGDKKPSTAWHAEFGDVNNDGLADLLVVKGNVETVGFVADADPNNLLIQQPGGTFKEGAKEAGVISFELGRSGALTDLNLDGHLDLVVTNRFAPVELWRNTSAAGNWLKLKLVQPGGNARAVGAWVEVRTKAGTQRRELTIGGGHGGGQWGWLHFGLADAGSAEVRVQWPGGEWGAWAKVKANQFASLTRGKTGAIHWNPPLNKNRE